MHYTVYKITNLVNQKYYIGQHQTDDLNDGYMGSGLMISRAIAKYGLENFRKEILFDFATVQEMNAKEKELVVIDIDKTYNLKEGGTGGWDHIPSDHHTKTREACIKMNKIHTDLLKTNAEYKKNFGEKISKSLKANYVKNSEKTQAFRNRFKNGLRPYTLGRKHTEEAKRRIGLANSIRLTLNPQLGAKSPLFGTIWITNGTESRKLMKDDLIPDGWRRGRTFEKPSILGTFWITNGISGRKILKTDMMPDGWRRGRPPHQQTTL